MNVAPDLTAPTLCIVPSNPAPEGARVGVFQTSDKVRLRYATFPKGAGPARGTICLLHGRTEFIEKYFETIADFQARGFAVATFDWRGQGGSQRLIGNARSGYVNRFEDYWTDLKSFHSTILLPDCPPPYYLVAHSTGGLVALHAAVRDRMMFERVFLTAPMLGLDSQLLSTRGMARLGGVLCACGLGRFTVGRAIEKQLPSEATFAGNPATSDHTRYMRMVDVLRARPDLSIGMPTVRWVAAAAAAMARAARDDFPGAIKIPVMMLAAARDEIVSTAAIEQLGLRMRTGRHAIIPAARHELFMENDAIRAQVFAAFDAFITKASG